MKGAKFTVQILTLALITPLVAGCLEKDDGDGNQEIPPWNSSLVLKVTNVGDYKINTSVQIAITANESVLLEKQVFGAGEHQEWILELEPQNYTVQVAAWALSRQEFNPNPTNVSASGGLSFDAAECPTDSITGYTVDVKYEDSGVPVAGPYVSERVRVSGTANFCG